MTPVGIHPQRSVRLLESVVTGHVRPQLDSSSTTTTARIVIFSSSSLIDQRTAQDLLAL